MIIFRQELCTLLTYYRKQMIKSGIIITFIIAFALISTYHIYHQFKDTRNQTNNSKSLEVTFHEKAKDKVFLSKAVAVSDSVGLSSRAYTFTIRNRLNIPVSYTIKIVKDDTMILDDDCLERQIPLTFIKGAIHREYSENKMFMLTDLKDNRIESRKLKGGSSVTYTVRFWTTNHTLPLDSDMHFHGKILVLENGVDIATAIS